EEDKGEVAEASDDEQEETEAKEAAPSKQSASDNGRLKASPLARKMAEEQGIELSNVQGSGPEGRIVKKDIENYEPSATGGAVQASREDTEHRVSQMRKTIARRLSESKFGSPHFYE